MSFRLKFFALTALILLAQGAHAGGANPRDPNIQSDSSFRRSLASGGKLCDKMTKNTSSEMASSMELSSEAPLKARSGKRGRAE